ncbi:MAG: pyridoxal-dependent decarboxylase, partial [Actinobacteria bacterium]|nr:pyridoxal-dependent decarboxylase [Actinomycetota bacterium]
MSDISDGLTQARQRIARAYDPRLLEDAGHRLATLLAANLARAEQSEGTVLPWVDPEEGIREAASQLRAAGAGDAAEAAGRAAAAGAEAAAPIGAASALPERFAGLVQTMLDRGLNLHDPRYIGHQVPAPVPVAGLFDAVGSVTNQVMAIYEMGPWATAVEQAMVRELGTEIGWAPGSFAGAVTHGGSLANLTALLTARNAALRDAWENGLACDGPQPVLLAHADAHYSVARAAGILGLGSR